MLAAPQDTYMASRAEALHQVESTIVELGTIFQQLAHMVSRRPGLGEGGGWQGPDCVGQRGCSLHPSCGLGQQAATDHT